MKRYTWFLAGLLGLAGPLHVTAQKDPPPRDADGLITKEAKQAIDAGLTYLIKRQADNGSWGTGGHTKSVAITSLCGLALLADGQRPGRGAHGDALTKAADFVLSQESKDLAGYFGGGTNFHGPMYVQGYAVLFLAEVQGTLTDKQKKEQAKAALTRGVKVILDAQNKQGGWRYHPTPGDADITGTACQLHALRAARDAGVEVPKEALDKGVAYVLSCQDPGGGGGFRYQPFTGPPGFPRTAAGVSAIQCAGLPKEDELAKSVGYLRAKKPGAARIEPEIQIHYYYGYYYATQALARAGGKDWKDWYGAMRDELLRARKQDGSWDNLQICPHYCTAMALLILQSPDSRLPSVKR